MARDVYKLRVQDVMSREVVAVYPDDTLHEALELIVENRISALPVVDAQGHCVGMISTSDLVDLTHELDDEMHNLGRASAGRQQWLVEQLTEALGSERVAEQMTEKVAQVKPSVRLTEAAALMLRNRVHRLPVVDDQERLVGIISTMDILSAFANGAP